MAATTQEVTIYQFVDKLVPIATKSNNTYMFRGAGFQKGLTEIWVS